MSVRRNPPARAGPQCATRSRLEEPRNLLVFLSGPAHRDGSAELAAVAVRRQPLRRHALAGGPQQPVDRGPGHSASAPPGLRAESDIPKLPEGLQLRQPQVRGRREILARRHAGQPPDPDQGRQRVVSTSPRTGFRFTSRTGVSRFRSHPPWSRQHPEPGPFRKHFPNEALTPFREHYP